MESVACISSQNVYLGTTTPKTVYNIILQFTKLYLGVLIFQGVSLVAWILIESLTWTLIWTSVVASFAVKT